MQLRELLTAASVGGVEVLAVRGDADVEIADLTHDTRLVEPGSCFACVPGARVDGHTLAPAAVERGAVALLVERPLELPVTEAEVASVRRALGPAASTLHGHPSRSMRCLGVTGTNGKTTTTYLLEVIARAAGDRPGVIGTTGARVDGAPLDVALTTPEATELQRMLAGMRDAGVKTVAMEVSSHALAQHRVDGTWFACVGFTNLSHDHLDFHGSLDEYFAAKAMLFDPARAALGAVNIDDPHGERLLAIARERELPTMTFSAAGANADVVIDGITLADHGSMFTLRDQRAGTTGEARLRLLGRHNVANAAAAAAVALGAGLSFDAVVSGLGAMTVVPGRLEPVDAGQPFTVLVDYAHTPDALATALASARELADGHRVLVVFGCGGDRDAAKRPAMGRVAVDGSDVAVLTNDNPRSEAPEAIAEAVLAGAGSDRDRIVVELDRRAAIQRAVDDARPGDVVLIAGKGHETGQTAAGETVPFDDRTVARDVLGGS